MRGIISVNTDPAEHRKARPAVPVAEHASIAVAAAPQSAQMSHGRRIARRGAGRPQRGRSGAARCEPRQKGASFKTSCGPYDSELGALLQTRSAEHLA